MWTLPSADEWPESPEEDHDRDRDHEEFLRERVGSFPPPCQGCSTVTGKLTVCLEICDNLRSDADLADRIGWWNSLTPQQQHEVRHTAEKA